jgi:hypothetical protein
VSALQLNWTQEPHLVPKHNLFGLRRVMMLDELECAIDTLNLAPPTKDLCPGTPGYSRTSA